MLVVMQRHHSTGDIHTVLHELNQLMSKLKAKQDAQDKRVLLRRLRRLIARGRPPSWIG